MEDLKAMARAKRVSSKRGRARHSHSKHANGAAGAGRDVAAASDALQDVLPSNWERYSDDGGSEDEGAAPPGVGEVRPKSKGADYSQLLSSDAPKLYEDLPEQDRMFSMMLEPGLGLWDGDAWLEAPSASEQQTAYDAAALLSLDLGLLSWSLARLHVAERLMVEKELFPKQERVKQEVQTSDQPARYPVSWTENRLKEDKQDNIGKAHDSAEIRNREVIGSSLRNNGGLNCTDYLGLAADGARSPVYASPVKSAGNISSLKGEALLLRNNVVEQASSADESTTVETSVQPSGYRKFVPAAAEADLDELLDMLDNAGQPPLNSNSLVNGTELAFLPDLTFLSNPSRGGPQFLKIDASRDSNRTPGFGSGNQYIAPTVGNTDKSEQTKASSKEDSSVSALSLDDDFDSWLDSI